MKIKKLPLFILLFFSAFAVTVILTGWVEYLESRELLSLEQENLKLKIELLKLEIKEYETN